MNDWSHHRIREKFLSFFEKQGHQRVASSPLVPAQDPTLLFTNAGMNQFKDIFLGRERSGFSRAVSVQKCMRVGGKHNDLDQVGFTPRHHTFFEMLGNFSFGDYFKKEAISFAWDLITEVYKISPEHLWITIYEEDEEARLLWKQLAGLSDHRIIPMGEKDNFWSMGDTGPCGPCSEIHYDLGPSTGCGKETCSPACECGRFLEVWNLVFMQYERDEEGNLHPLPSPSIDTGMGLERIAAILQGVKSNFQTDLFLPLLRYLEKRANRLYAEDSQYAPAFRVLSDHARAITFLMAEGIYPSNEGRGYVLRRLIRRALRFARQLEIKPPVLPGLMEGVISIMGSVYPEICKEKETIKKMVVAEERRFEKTLQEGVARIEELIQRLKEKGEEVISGEEVFHLYDTHGIPVDWVEELATEMGMKVDLRGFQRRMEEHRQQSKQAHPFVDRTHDLYESLARQGVETTFVGYETLEAKGKVQYLFQEGEEKTALAEGEEGEMIVNTTPFYAESGGQVGDTGILRWDEGEAIVLDTQKPLGTFIIHMIKISKGRLKKGEKISLKVDKKKREATQRHHTATHILHSALRKVLGKHVKQMGSLVAPDRLRFDFSHPEPLTQEEIERIENLANEVVLQNRRVSIRYLSKEEALKEGALAFFGEKYGKTVRVVGVEDYSLELCGGCHVTHTGHIGLIKIIQERSLASGIRRLEAKAGLVALSQFQKTERIMQNIKDILKVGEDGLIERLQELQHQVKTLKKELQDAHIRLATREDKQEKILQIDGDVSLLVRLVETLDIPQLRHLGDTLRQKMVKRGIVILGNLLNEKGVILVTVTPDLEKEIPAHALAKKLGQALGGSGGGKAHMAQAGTPDVGRIQEIFGLAPKMVKEMRRG